MLSIRKNLLALLAATLSAIPAIARTTETAHTLLPAPQHIEFHGGDVRISAARLMMAADSAQWADTLTALGVRIDPRARFLITGKIVDSIPGAGISDEAYTLGIDNRRIDVSAVSSKGIRWALQTLRQLAESTPSRQLRLPRCIITDWPAFPWRGFMMDVGRSYISLDELKREIDAMSLFKLNVFHWHLTENQAWRLESRLFPMLNDSINTTRQPGRYYTIDEARQLVAYCRERGIMLLPEIDMPGHSAAFERTFRHDMQSAEGKKILRLLVEEACATFDEVPYLHIGTDEVRFTDPEFVPEMVAFVRSHGKKVISWNPGWHYEPGEIDMTHLWSYRGKGQKGIPAIDSKLHYLNHFDLYADIRALYRSKIYRQTSATPDVAGAEIAIWNDRYVADEATNASQNNLYPIMMAMAERAWRGGGTEYFDSLGTNMDRPGTDDFKEFADFERRMLHHKATSLRHLAIPYVKQTNVHWRITDAFPNGGDLSRRFPPETEGPAQSYTYADSVYNTRRATGAGIYLRHVWGPATIPGFYADPQPDHTAYAFTRVYSPADQTVGLQAETQNYSRSEPDLAPLPGSWDYRHSRIWINGDTVAPPAWQSTHRVRSNEISLTNENAAARRPLLVKLRKGWNDVMIKLPVGSFSTPETRLVKWMFTFVFTTPDGSREADLIYDPDAQAPGKIRPQGK
ncbi:family 20 glycosylhydrolase [Paramuribaculum intestinale]|uniref:family 20 glycosylhydrolase n=1 Tax=Paramuribaculum intestinale TaxID=2094151 RepID=UPI0025B061FB|nr:family 20 glycosylhydrolase [Paramuribaculum intestinale]